jgi:glycerol kinase
VLEVTAMGAAALAGLGVGFWRDRGEIGASGGEHKLFEPSLPADRRESLYAGWKRAVERSRGWVKDEAEA